ncbi:MAG: hypothetical protein EHM40_16845 [Chloroflexi bacterium]|nr:MAG: hypothetical protein EHM40_16845 [Chloroflexota bacterium]
MDQNQATIRHEPETIEKIQCALLVGKIMVEDNGQFSQAEIDLANLLLSANWNPNIIDFLEVVAGVAHPGMDVLTEARGALIYPLNK